MPAFLGWKGIAGVRLPTGNVLHSCPGTQCPALAAQDPQLRAPGPPKRCLKHQTLFPSLTPPSLLPLRKTVGLAQLQTPGPTVWPCTSHLTSLIINTTSLRLTWGWRRLRHIKHSQQASRGGTILPWACELHGTDTWSCLLWHPRCSGQGWVQGGAPRLGAEGMHAAHRNPESERSAQQTLIRIFCIQECMRLHLGYGYLEAQRWTPRIEPLFSRAALPLAGNKHRQKMIIFRQCTGVNCTGLWESAWNLVKNCITFKILYNYNKEDKIQRIMGIYLILSFV